jgi:hypothetical protein
VGLVSQPTQGRVWKLWEVLSRGAPFPPQACMWLLPPLPSPSHGVWSLHPKGESAEHEGGWAVEQSTTVRVTAVILIISKMAKNPGRGTSMTRRQQRQVGQGLFLVVRASSWPVGDHSLAVSHSREQAL